MLQRPPGAPGLRHVITLWRDLSAGRGQGLNGPAPLSWADIRAYQEIMGGAFKPEEARAALILDRAYLNARAGG